MSKSTDSGKVETFAMMFNRVLRRPSHKSIKDTMLSDKNFIGYIENAQETFGFKWTDESLDNFIRDWVIEIQRLGGQVDKNMERMRAYADGRLARLGMESQDPDSLKAIEKFKEIFDNLKINDSSIIIDGKEFKGFKMYDPKNPIRIETANKSEKQIDFEKEMINRVAYRLDHDDPHNVYDFKLLDFTKQFCLSAGSNMIKQFQVKAETFRRRLDLIETSKKYRFGDSFLPLLVHHNKNDYGYRRMPRDNMWIEVGLKFDNVFVSGVHIAKVYVDTNDSGFGSNLFRFYDEIIPSSYKNVGISVFVVGIENDKTQFYYHFILENSDIEMKKMKSRYAYACPHCSMPMVKLQDRAIYCDKEACIKAFQDGSKTVYDMNDKKVKDQMRLFEMKSIWKTEDKIRQFSTNLLDFLTNKRVKIIDNYTEADLVERNKKRAKRGKSALFPVSIIKVDGTLKQYVSFISKKYRGNYKLARIETPIDGHHYRFWKRSKWTRIYAWIKNCKTDEEIIKRLAELKRVDKDKNVLPDEEQYEWDSVYNVIKIWKLPSWRFKGEGDPRQRIDVIHTGDDNE